MFASKNRRLIYRMANEKHRWALASEKSQIKLMAKEIVFREIMGSDEGNWETFCFHLMRRMTWTNSLKLPCTVTDKHIKKGAMSPLSPAVNPSSASTVFQPQLFTWFSFSVFCQLFLSSPNFIKRCIFPSCYPQGKVARSPTDVLSLYILFLANQ